MPDNTPYRRRDQAPQLDARTRLALAVPCGPGSMSAIVRHRPARAVPTAASRGAKVRLGTLARFDQGVRP